MAIYVVLYNGRASELDRKRVKIREGDDPTEESVAIHDAIGEWMLAVGDTIAIVEDHTK